MFEASALKPLSLPALSSLRWSRLPHLFREGHILAACGTAARVDRYVSFYYWTTAFDGINRVIRMVRSLEVCPPAPPERARITLLGVTSVVTSLAWRWSAVRRTLLAAPPWRTFKGERLRRLHWWEGRQNVENVGPRLESSERLSCACPETAVVK